MTLSVSQIQQVYLAFFNRPADVSGLAYWQNFTGNQEALLQEFAQSREYLDEFQGMSNREIINQVYHNLFDRSAEAEGMNFWLGEMNAGWVDIGNVAYAIMGGARNSDARIVSNKTIAATRFTDALQVPAEQEAYGKSGEHGVLNLAKNWLSSVGEQADSLARATNAIDGLIFSLLGNGGDGEASEGIDIVFDYSRDSSHFFDDPLRRELMEQVADVFEARLQDDLTAARYTKISFWDPSARNEEVVIGNFQVLDGQLIVFVGADSASNFASGVLAVGGNGGYTVSGSTAYDRGQGVVTGKAADDYASWGGTICFDRDAKWYFDSDLSTANDIVGYDFYSVAMHELAHVLGFGASDSWKNQVKTVAATVSFTGEHALAVYGVNPRLNAAGNHWDARVDSVLPDSGVRQIACMTPSIGHGIRHAFTELDYAGLADVGWEVSGISAHSASALTGFDDAAFDLML